MKPRGPARRTRGGADNDNVGDAKGSTMSVRAQGGGFALGLIAGLLIGLALALGLAVYITKVPVPFLDKVPQRTSEQDRAEAARNRSWDPNAPLAPKAAARAGAVASGSVATTPVAPVMPAPPREAAPTPRETAPTAAPAPPARAERDPAAILAGRSPDDAPLSTRSTADPFIYMVQAGAYARADDAEQQRARLAMLGMEARVTEREQAGRTMYRVRVGPFDARTEAEGAQSRLQAAGIAGQLVRVEKP